jgi:murein endopeptidase
VRYRDSRALGLPYAGSLQRGTRLPARGRHFVTWDPILRRRPNRRWRRHGTDDLVRMLVEVGRRYARREAGEQPMLIGDLSRPRGGDFGITYGIVGHSTHQNGLDADVYYPRTDRRLGAPRTVAQVDRRLAQRLVDLFVAAGAATVLVGPNLALHGPPGVVVPYPNHDNHLHVRIGNPEA